ncbi:MAG TPA: ATP-binding protein [Candidatus Eremiobacteraceae bacterium]|nr:ATP-binding protein [Candidatus Eremiobacteraceae bacterium]
MSKQPAADVLIDARPTKELFIEMLTRDVALTPAIIDLADNCTDGARRLRNGKAWSGLQVMVDAKADTFTIADNCGGIPVELARKYAFRFGRPDDFKAQEGEVGRFGVGMKRGLFKLGKHFHIRSTTAKTQFDVTIDVEKWAKENEWQFKFDKTPIENGRFPPDQQGTIITVKKLHPEVKEHFGEIAFVEELRRQLTTKLEESIRKGLAVRVNEVTLKAHIRCLVAEKALAPAKKSFKVKGPTKGTVDVELWCGLGKPESRDTARAESGWYVFCNGRMLLEADKTTATGWGVEDDESIPAYHPQFNDFRGFAYLDAADAADLPWNTTKTALDTDHPVYRRVKQEMIAIARPVIDYFNKRKEENDALKQAGEEPKGRLQTLFEKSTVKAIDDISPRPVFKTPAPILRTKQSQKTQRITFERAVELAERVKDCLGVGSWTKVGEEVFDYYYNAECADE